MKSKVVDFFTFYGEYGSEILLLRYNVLKDYVDEFVISESNRSHNGNPVQYKCREKIKEWGLPEDKFRIIELDIPSSEFLEVQNIDIDHCTNDNLANNTLEANLARARARIQKNSLLHVLDQYDDDTVFIHGDNDEIINPNYIESVVQVLNSNENSYMIIPLLHFEGSADLSVHYRTNNAPKIITATLMANKKVLKQVTPLELRVTRYVPNHIYPMFLVDDNTGNTIDQMGWHFSWMGDETSKLTKVQDFEHYTDKFDWLEFGSYDTSESREFLTKEFKEGDVPPCGDVNLVLTKYDTKLLPKECFGNPIIEKFLFPSKYKKINSFAINDNSKSTSWIVDNFYEDPDAVREFALQQEYLEGEIGRRTHHQFLFPRIKERFEKIMGRKITKWEDHGINGRFQIACAGEPLVYHFDNQKWGGMIYLTPDAPHSCGTTLYAHKQTRVKIYHDNEWNAPWVDVSRDCHLDGTPFDPVDILGNVYNRLVIFDASVIIHSASQYFGTVKENAKLWQTFFFDTD